MLVKRTGNEKIDEAPRRGYEISGYYYDGTNDYVIWKKKFWRDKQAAKVKLMQKEIYG